MKSLPLVLLVLGGLLTATASSAFGASSASVADLVLPDVVYSHTTQSSSGTMSLTATNDGIIGFNVTIMASDFVYSGPHTGSVIPALNFSITSANAPTRIAGQSISGIGGPRVPNGAIGALNVPRKTLQSQALFGVGTYSQAPAVTFVIPGQTRAGTYTFTLTTTISAGP